MLATIFRHSSCVQLVRASFDWFKRAQRVNLRILLLLLLLLLLLAIKKWQLEILNSILLIATVIVRYSILPNIH